jgi:sporulation protein YlmC with PRC-barrel domain
VGSARASKLIGSKVYKGDTSIGNIEDVLVNLGDSHVSAVILSVGGFLGIGDNWSPFQLVSCRLAARQSLQPI